MGIHADDAIYASIEFEGLCDEYVSGDIGLEEAFEYGLVDHNGEEHPALTNAWERNKIGTLEDCLSELNIAERDILTATLIEGNQYRTPLNREACYNLKHEVPTCNICREFMQERVGRYGKFYFCSCEGQPTVSDNYWQKVRIK